MSQSICATGRVVALPPGVRLASGATHALLGPDGRTLALLRSRTVTLDVVAGRTARVCGRRRGQVVGEPAPVLEVTQALAVDRLPLRPGLDPFAPGAALTSAPGVDLRPFVGG